MGDGKKETLVVYADGIFEGSTTKCVLGKDMGQCVSNAINEGCTTNCPRERGIGCGMWVSKLDVGVSGDDRGFWEWALQERATKRVR